MRKRATSDFHCRQIFAFSDTGMSFISLNLSPARCHTRRGPREARALPDRKGFHLCRNRVAIVARAALRLFRFHVSSIQMSAQTTAALRLSRDPNAPMAHIGLPKHGSWGEASAFTRHCPAGKGRMGEQKEGGMHRVAHLAIAGAEAIEGVMQGDGHSCGKQNVIDGEHN